MIFFIYGILLIMFFYSIIRLCSFYRSVTIDHFYTIALKSFLKKQYDSETERYFCSYAIFETVSLLHKNKKKDLLINLSFARIEGAMKFLSEIRREDLASSLFAHFDYRKALLELEDLVKKEPTNNFILGELAELYFIDGNQQKMNMILDRIEEAKTSKYTLAKKLYLQAFLCLREGDMMSASDNCNKALKFFNKSNFHVEEAKTYLLIGIIYKACAIFDVAQFMFEAALDIFSKIEDMSGMIETYGNLAMLMSAQERFEEAEDLLNKALNINKKAKNQTYILNQKGLIYLLKKNFDEAEKILKKANDIDKKIDNSLGLAFSLELLSYVKYEQKLFEEAIKAAEEAEALYKKNHNTSARLESKYLQALSWFELFTYDEAENRAREIIEITKKEQTNFHAANAYSLLGLVFIKKGELDRAKSLFKESLRLEHMNERFAGIATDYFNIGLIEEKTGHIDEAFASLESALEYASLFGETNLSKLIESKIRNLS